MFTLKHYMFRTTQIGLIIASTSFLFTTLALLKKRNSRIQETSKRTLHLLTNFDKSINDLDKTISKSTKTCNELNETIKKINDTYGND